MAKILRDPFYTTVVPFKGQVHPGPFSQFTFAAGVVRADALPLAPAFPLADRGPIVGRTRRSSRKLTEEHLEQQRCPPPNATPSFARRTARRRAYAKSMVDNRAASEHWLPEHQRHAIYSCAHIDRTVEHLSSVLHEYLKADPLELESKFTLTTEEVVLKAVAPLPQAVPRIFADALNQMRNMLEHTLYAEVRHRSNRTLTDRESKSVELPATDTDAAFDTWSNHTNRRSIGLFAQTDELHKRLRRLQPFNRRDSDAHPLRVLVEYTNFAKHREPAVALTRVGRVDRDGERSDTAPNHQGILKVGATLAVVPRGVRTELSIWPQVVVQRPHTGEWRTLMHEVGELEEWVRRIALPLLSNGRTDLTPLPPHLNIDTGYANAEDALRVAEPVSAAERSTLRMQAEGIRRDLTELLVGRNGEPLRAQYEGWLRSLDDARVRQMFDPVAAAAERGDSRSTEAAIREWERDARLHATPEDR